MARDPVDRFDSAAGLAAELQAWLEGAKRQEEARAVVARAEDKGPETAALRSQAPGSDSAGGVDTRRIS